jgi:hypothetical protein
MSKYRRLTAGIAFCMGAVWLGAWVSIASVIGQPWTAVVIFLYSLMAVFIAFAIGRESTKP